MSVDVAEWEARPFFREFDVKIEAADDGYARLAVRREAVKLRGVRGALNGGIVATFGEAAMHVCLASMLRDDERIGRTHEVIVAYLSGARGDVTLVEARMIRKGGRLATGDVELRDASNGELNTKIRVACEILPAPAAE